ncbi:MarR family winged helix-turn-helix transcriptional regulator [Microbacterium tenebrionis]|uniref:MarR family winged helix-turn-helix transcriptional regulator n=1 Tax=Microbacterium tenebrionis TaxID=2830665 RepID=UPI00202ADB6E|nr:MarR family transcriptional regulator [Microbacterium ihumii]
MGGPALFRMLDALATASEPLSVSEIGEAIGVDQPRVSRLVQQAVQRGLVQREADPEDARRTRIALTDDGRRIAKGMRGERRQVLSKALESAEQGPRVVHRSGEGRARPTARQARRQLGLRAQTPTSFGNGTNSSSTRPMSRISPIPSTP